jgi:hypothetical protein
MVKAILRALVGASGAACLALAAIIWLDPARPAAQLGLAPTGALGIATLRADVAGFFGAAGLMALSGAVRGEARLLTAPLVMISIALAGRTITLARLGDAPGLVTPMAIEGVLLAALVAARLFMKETAR